MSLRGLRVSGISPRLALPLVEHTIFPHSAHRSASLAELNGLSMLDPSALVAANAITPLIPSARLLRTYVCTQVLEQLWAVAAVLQSETLLQTNNTPKKHFEQLLQLKEILMRHKWLDCLFDDESQNNNDNNSDKNDVKHGDNNFVFKLNEEEEALLKDDKAREQHKQLRVGKWLQFVSNLISRDALLEAAAEVTAQSVSAPAMTSSNSSTTRSLATSVAQFDGVQARLFLHLMRVARLIRNETVNLFNNDDDDGNYDDSNDWFADNDDDDDDDDDDDGYF